MVNDTEAIFALRSGIGISVIAFDVSICKAQCQAKWYCLGVTHTLGSLIRYMILILHYRLAPRKDPPSGVLYPIERTHIYIYIYMLCGGTFMLGTCTVLSTIVCNSEGHFYQGPRVC